MSIADEMAAVREQQQGSGSGSIADQMGQMREEQGLTPGIPKTFAKGVVRGVEGILSSTGDVARWAGDVTNIGSLSRAGTWWQKYWQQAAHEGWEAPDPYVFRGDFLDKPSFTRAVGIVGEAIPSLALAMGTGGTAVAAARGLGLVSKTASAMRLGKIAGAGTLGLIEGAPQYREAREAGKSEAEATFLGATSVAATTALEYIGISMLLRGGPNIGGIAGAAAGMAIKGLSESSQEVFQTIAQNMVAKYGYDDTQELFEGIMEAAIGGMGVGMIASPATGKLNSFFKKHPDASDQDLQNGHDMIEALTENAAEQQERQPGVDATKEELLKKNREIREKEGGLGPEEVQADLIAVQGEGLDKKPQGEPAAAEPAAEEMVEEIPEVPEEGLGVKEPSNPDQKRFVEDSVQTAGDIALVDRTYSTDSVIDQYARAYARHIYGETEESEGVERAAKKVIEDIRTEPDKTLTEEGGITQEPVAETTEEKLKGKIGASHPEGKPSGWGQSYKTEAAAKAARTKAINERGLADDAYIDIIPAYEWDGKQEKDVKTDRFTLRIGRGEKPTPVDDAASRISNEVNRYWLKNFDQKAREGDNAAVGDIKMLSNFAKHIKEGDRPGKSPGGEEGTPEYMQNVLDQHPELAKKIKPELKELGELDVTAAEEAKVAKDAAELEQLAKDENVDVFRSGASNINDLKGYVDAKVPVGVVADKLSKNSLDAAALYSQTGGKVFVDSGAYSARAEGTPPVDFDKVMDKYGAIVSKAGIEGRRNITVVAPDKVGDQKGTFGLLQKHKAALDRLPDVDVIVPIQKGDMSIGEAFQTTAGILKKDDFRVGIPSNKSPWSEEDIKDLFSVPDLWINKNGEAYGQPKKVHLLGMSYANKDFKNRIALIRKYGGKDVDITADANRIAPKVGEGRPITEAAREERKKVENEKVDYVATAQQGIWEEAADWYENMDPDADVTDMVMDIGGETFDAEQMASVREHWEGKLSEEHFQAIAESDDSLQALFKAMGETFGADFKPTKKERGEARRKAVAKNAEPDKGKAAPKEFDIDAVADQLKGVTVKVRAVDETGEDVIDKDGKPLMVEEDAASAYRENTDKTKIYENILDCLGLGT